MNQTSDKQTVFTLVSLCVQHGVTHAVFSPGSRNAPLVIGFNREEKINCRVIVDERSAAFFALGMAQKSRKPVVLVCTSGTALLNYAPAVAEAYYQRIPLIVVSADRPKAWIDQEDGQTIRQFDALRNIVKKSYQLPGSADTKESHWFANRMINDAFITALTGRKAPVHINIPLNEPLYGTGNFSSQERFIRPLQPEKLRKAAIQSLAERFNRSEKVMILAGFLHETKQLRLLLNTVSRFSSVAFLAELIANLSSENTVTALEPVFASVRENEAQDFCPDLLISFGGSLVSKSAKRFLRLNPPSEHWYIGKEETTIDTFQCLTHRIDVSPETFFAQLLPFLQPKENNYQTVYLNRERKLQLFQNQSLQQTGWNDLKAFSLLMQSIPENSDLHLSNGMSIRLAQQFKQDESISVYANRGTNGIDGSTSTAAGSASLNAGTTTLISGDISFLYDSSALWNNYLSPRLKMVVLNNGGGGIFRKLEGLSSLPEMNACFETPHRIDFEKLAALYQLKFLRATDEATLKNAIKMMYAENKVPVLLEVTVP
jgi:2-succinyl-5-enolpyruvyl-6-hydroxy-3-cyclohexene-1-carboxylate synthase